MIRNSIICDICGVERKLANHWFTAQEHDGEFRIGAFLQSKSVRPGLKHLCGQTCLHRLVDDFLVRHMGGRTPPSPSEEKNSQQKSHLLLPDSLRESDAVTSKRSQESRFDSETDHEFLDDFESSAVLIPTPPIRKYSNGTELTLEQKHLGASRKKPQTSVLNASKASRIATAPCALASPMRHVAGSLPKTSKHSREPRPTVKSMLPERLKSSSSQALVKHSEPTIKAPSLAVKPSNVSPIDLQVRSIAEAQVQISEPVTPVRAASPLSSLNNSSVPFKAPVAQSAALPRVPNSTPMRTIAGAWERARLWESRSAHPRQASGKK